MYLSFSTSTSTEYFPEMYLSTFQVLYKLYLSTYVLKYKVLLPGSASYTVTFEAVATDELQRVSLVQAAGPSSEWICNGNHIPAMTICTWRMSCMFVHYFCRTVCTELCPYLRRCCRTVSIQTEHILDAVRSRGRTNYQPSSLGQSIYAKWWLNTPQIATEAFSSNLLPQRSPEKHIKNVEKSRRANIIFSGKIPNGC